MPLCTPQMRKSGRAGVPSCAVIAGNNRASPSCSKNQPKRSMEEARRRPSTQSHIILAVRPPGAVRQLLWSEVLDFLYFIDRTSDITYIACETSTKIKNTTSFRLFSFHSYNDSTMLTYVFVCLCTPYWQFFEIFGDNRFLLHFLPSFSSANKK